MVASQGYIWDMWRVSNIGDNLNIILKLSAPSGVYQIQRTTGVH